VLLFLAVSLGVLAADLGIKAWAFERVAGEPVVLTRDMAGDPSAIPDHEPWVLVPQVLNLKLTTNTGAVFGLGKGAQFFFILISAAVVPAIVWFFARRTPARAYALHVALALILAGAVGNLYDRIRFNAVRDMFWMLPGTRLWPWIFNLADAALMIGVGILMIIFYVHDTRARAAPAARG
jgi:signal peptidase II